MGAELAPYWRENAVRGFEDGEGDEEDDDRERGILAREAAERAIPGPEAGRKGVPISPVEALTKVAKLGSWWLWWLRHSPTSVRM
jgi:hypothetical protein